jgi:hypothetical protein
VFACRIWRNWVFFSIVEVLQDKSATYSPSNLVAGLNFLALSRIDLTNIS